MPDTILQKVDAVTVHASQASRNAPGYRMLHRQRAILALLAESGGRVSRLTLTKWAFLLREEYPACGGSSFYRFLPYHYGPFSFCLYQEVGALEKHGLLCEDNNDWVLTEPSAGIAETTPVPVRRDIHDLVRDHSRRTSAQLLEYVYKRYPWYTVNSKATNRRQGNREDAEVAVYTAGYEGLLVDAFLDGLMRSGIRRLIDVRHNPVSRRYGYHKSTLARLCGHLDIDYIHVPELGIHGQNRQNLDAPGARTRLFDRYENTTLRSETEAIRGVASAITEIPSALVCMEACPTDCHRSRLATSVATESGLEIRHLEFAA